MKGHSNGWFSPWESKEGPKCTFAFCDMTKNTHFWINFKERVFCETLILLVFFSNDFFLFFNPYTMNLKTLRTKLIKRNFQFWYLRPLVFTRNFYRKTTGHKYSDALEYLKKLRTKFEVTTKRLLRQQVKIPRQFLSHVAHGSLSYDVDILDGLWCHSSQ